MMTSISEGVFDVSEDTTSSSVLFDAGRQGRRNNSGKKEQGEDLIHWMLKQVTISLSLSLQ